MAGYSGTPLPKKLSIKGGFKIVLRGIPADVRKELDDALRGCQIVDGGGKDLDFVHLFVKTQSELKKTFLSWAKKLQPAGILWVSWPKKSSGVATYFDENRVCEIS